MDFNVNEITTDAPSNMLSCILGEDRPITVDEACDLRLLLFGNTVDTFGTEWTEQSFHFRRRPLSYGLRQKKPGPCGVLAAVQAHVLYELLFGSAAVTLDSGLLRPKAVEQKEALARALTSILWQAGRKKEVVIAVKWNKIVFDSSITSNILRADGMIEYLRLKYFRSRNCVLEYFINFISELMNDDSGSCVLFLYSVILTHGIESIKEEMDYPESHLIGEDGYCSQEVVNLMLIGKAVPNLFDGNLELNSGGEEKSIHRGIPGQSAIGLLSLYEYQNTCTVGNHYKNPVYPIWVLLSGSHFSVLFGTSTDILEKTSPDDSFRLLYYDGLSVQNEENSFIIKPFAKQVEDSKDMTLPAVIRCIYTRWPHASIESENIDS
ncbi:probable ubiquitin carboxyl-terminal hydrolase MINDY-4 [Stegodyphus dumicola]|uniref:probable ubiquitin carboxyl-terminal hydrolase MINDY-4 n=1 Tax=Stegodyphus dumicola TaxID=202533 RepID=UPI0015B21A08|nr:probable ubiquitin carboxyl-terminal hydrolase MINDY-4 [Stegodyphus dumicola]